MIYTGAKQPLQPATDPWSQFDRLFTGRSEASSDERLRALQIAREEISRISPRVATEERPKLEAHLASLDNLQQRLQAKASLCAGPSLPGRIDAGDVAQTPLVMDAQIELITAAFACDLHGSQACSMRSARPTTHPIRGWDQRRSSQPHPLRRQ